MCKQLWVLQKHQRALLGTGFYDCADCPGTSGKVEENGMMRCSRSGPKPVEVTLEQAQACDGTKPILVVKQEKHFLPLRRPAQKLVQATVSI